MVHIVICTFTQNMTLTCMSFLRNLCDTHVIYRQQQMTT